MKKNIFITGISGCIGHYLFDVLAFNPEYHLYLLVRNPAKLKFNPQAFSNVTLIEDRIENIEKYSELLREMDYVVHLATGWGGTEVGYEYSLVFFKLLHPERCQKVIYFSTASILDSEGKLFEEAEKIGTSYIKAKARFQRELPQLKIYPKVITLFPTWVLGGDENHPYSHASLGIGRALKWLWLLRFFKLDLSFHFIHARDIALITKYLLENEVEGSSFILGNPAITAAEFIKEVCRFFNKKVYFQINLSPSIKAVAWLFKGSLSPWDTYSLQRKNYQYKVVDASTFGIKSDYQSLAGILKDMR